MIVLPALLASVLFGLGVFLLLQRTLTRIVIGLALLAHSANLLVVIAGGGPGSAPFVNGASGASGSSDPLPQALALTAIVIAFAVTSFLLALAYRSWVQRGDDEVEDDIEDRRIAQLAGKDAHGWRGKRP